ARDLGASAFARFRRVITPLTLRSLQAALIIIFIGAAGDYSFQVIAGPVTVNSITQYMLNIQQQSGGWNQAAVVAVMLMFSSLLGALLLAGLTSVIVRRGQS
ncbi:MAG TPA: ABC transporter permease, partial [Spirochaetia bacterium]|nr:ABC transporter permease [Spirochaetia bacterium]